MKTEKNATTEQEVQLTPQAIEILDEANLNWNVVKRPVLFKLPGEQRIQILTNKSIILREDTEQVLEVLGSNYEILQNSKMVQIAIELAGNKNLKVSSGGFLSDGQLVYLQLDFKKGVRVGSDSLKRYVTLMNSHDGSCSFKVGFGNTVMSCENQFDYFSRNSSMNFRHSSSLRESVEAISSKIEDIRMQEKILTKNFKRFASVGEDANKDLVKDLMKSITGVDITLSPEQKAELYSTRKLNTTEEILACVQNEMNAKGRTLWGAFNGITYYTNHIMSRKEDRKEYDLKIGRGYEMNKKAYNFAVSLV